MKNAYNITDAPPPQPKKSDKLPGFQIYKEKVQPYFFKQNNWSVPISKINSFFEK